MSVWECQSCGFRYDPAKGDPHAGVAPGTPFEKLPRTWHCPKCRAGRDEFEELDPNLEEEELDDEDEIEDEEEPEDEESYDEDEPEDEAFDDEEEEEEGEGEEDEAFDEDEEEDEDEGLEDFPEGGEDEEEDEEDFDDEEEDEGGEESEAVEFEEESEGDGEGEEDESEEDEESEEGEEIGEEDEDFDELEDEGEELDEDEESLDEETRYICTDCGWVYDPRRGNPESGVAPGTSFDDLYVDWVCPSCGANQERFAPHEDELEAVPPVSPSPAAPASSEESDIEQLADTGRPSIDPAMPRRLSPGLGDILFRPVPLFNTRVEETVSTLTLLGPRAEKPIHLTTPLIVAPVPFGPLTNALKIAIARSTARVGTACTSGGPTLPEARRAASIYILEVAPGRPAPSPEELHAADAAEIIMGRGWTSLEEELVPGRASGGMLAPISSPLELVELATALRKSLKGPLGIRIPAGSIEADLESVMKARPDYLVLECYGSGAGTVPRHVREHANLPSWLAVHRARQYLESHGHEGIGVVVAGDLRSPADFAKLLALGADAVLISTAAVVAMGMWEMRQAIDQMPRELAEMRFEPNAAVDRLVNFLRASTEEIMDFCRLVGKADVHELDRSDLLASSEELARALGLSNS